MELHVIVEEPSAEAAIREIGPKIIQRRAKLRIINMNSKDQLLRKLPSRLDAYADRIKNGEDLKIMILVDRDGDDCKVLKKKITDSVKRAGLIDKSHQQQSFRVVTRVVCEELEAWFLGDTKAIRAAYTSLPPIDPSKGIFRQPDKSGRGTWESLASFFKSNNLYRNHYPKIEGATRISAKMDVTINRSVSFQHFRQGVISLL